MKLSILGAGYVGLISGVCLAEKGHDVVCVDIDAQKVDTINQGIPPIYERDLEIFLKRNINRNLRATTDLPGAIMETDVTLITVGTPFDGRKIDLNYVKTVSHQVGTILRNKNSYYVVVVKSTVVPGTTDETVLPILEQTSGRKAGRDFGVGMNPEFLREGNAIHDFMFPDRVVLGGIDSRTHDTLEDVYRVFAGVDRIRTNNKTAEMIKYTSNSLLTTAISFSNEIANLCASIGGIDIVDVMKAVHMDKRLSPLLPDGSRIVPSFTTYLEAGCGFGGSCFPKDVKALISHGKKYGTPMWLLKAVMRVNEEQPRQVVRLLRKHFPSLRGVRIAVLGLAYKPGTDDMRDSPAIPVIRDLLARKADVAAHDPVALSEARKLLWNEKVRFCENLSQAIEGAEAIILLTRWEEFRRVPELLIGMDPQPLVIDGRRMLEKSSVQRYEGIGL